MSSENKCTFDKKTAIAVTASVAALSIASFALWKRLRARPVAATGQPDSSRSFWNEKYSAWTKEKGPDDGLFSMKPADILLTHDHVLSRLRQDRDPSTIKVLEIGAGQGRNGIHLVKEYGFSVKAIDVSDVACKDARRFADEKLGDKASLYTVEEADILLEDEANDVLGTERYDLILALFVQVTPDHERLHKRIVKSLKPGGVLILQGFSPKQAEYREKGTSVGGPPLPNLYDAETLKKELSGLTIDTLRERDADLTGYGLFRGTSALVEFVGSKPAAE